MARRDGIGQAIHDLRVRRIPRLTQAQLAAKAGVSLDTIAKLEQGQRSTARLPTLATIAAALDVDVAQLLAAPARIDDAAGGQDAGVLAIRHSTITGRPGAEPVDAAELARAAELSWSHYWSNRFDVLGATTPALIRSARATVDDRPSPAAWAALADIYGAAASMLVHLGKVDLAHTLMERAQGAAGHAGDELRHSALIGWMSWLLLHQTGSGDEARHLAITEADRIEPSVRTATPAQIAVWGSLLVSAAVAAAREDKADDADEILNLAEVAAVRLDGMTRTPPRTVYERTFGRALVVMQAVDIAVVTGRPARALTEASKMPADADLPLASRARHAADRAHALVQLGRLDAAETTLLGIERTAPRWVRYQPYPREIVRDLWEHKRRSSALVGLAGRLDVPLG